LIKKCDTDSQHCKLNAKTSYDLCILAINNKQIGSHLPAAVKKIKQDECCKQLQQMVAYSTIPTTDAVLRKTTLYKTKHRTLLCQQLQRESDYSATVQGSQVLSVQNPDGIC